MRTILTEVYDAFISAGVPDDKARKAAEALSGNERRLDGLENKFDRRLDDLSFSMGRMESGQDTRFTKIEGELTLPKWMIGFTLAFVVAIAAKLFVH